MNIKPKVRHYNTWIKEGNNRFIYNYQYQNNRHRLSAAGFHVYFDNDILYSKKDVLEAIELEHIDTCEFVYMFSGHYCRTYTIFAKKLEKKQS